MRRAAIVAAVLFTVAAAAPARANGSHEAHGYVCGPVTTPHLQAVYVNPTGIPDSRADIVVPKLRDAVAAGATYLDDQAIAAGGRARLRFRCDRNGALNVAVMHAQELTPLSNFEQIVGYLGSRGYHDSHTKYVVFFDACGGNLGNAAHVYAGIGGDCGTEGESNLADDDRKAPSNRNNRAPTYSLTYQGTSKDRGPQAYAILHETLHQLGAVQRSAPHSDGAGHCTDANDIMCGWGPTKTLPSARCGQPSDGADRIADGAFLAVDCGHDDYFNPHPRPGSYLASHWNIATDSLFLAHR